MRTVGGFKLQLTCNVRNIRNFSILYKTLGVISDENAISSRRPSQMQRLAIVIIPKIFHCYFADAYRVIKDARGSIDSSF